MADPPSVAGAVQDTVAEALPATAVAAVGAPGAVVAAAGVTEADVPAAPVPAALVAVTEKVYGVPSVRPVQVSEVPLTYVQVAPALGLAVTV